MRQVFRGRGVASLTKTHVVAVYMLHPAGLISTNDAKSVFHLEEVFFYAQKLIKKKRQCAVYN